MKRKTTRLLLAFSTLGLILILALVPGTTEKAYAFHTPEELSYFNFYKETNATIDSNAYFLTHLSCEGCHGFDQN
ncbi:MAG: hypothetical protein AAF598_22510, partial [Bacteroidota bacterium]